MCADTMSAAQRHYCMSRIGGRDTRPELLVRRHLWRAGYRYRVCDKRLPGKPDVVLRRWRTVIFVNGCFWHGHDCGAFSLPRTNTEFWRNKITRNQKRDALVTAQLRRMGYNVITLWECQLRPPRARATLESLLVTLSGVVLESYGATPPRAAEHATGYGNQANGDNAISLAAEPVAKYARSDNDEIQNRSGSSIEPSLTADKGQ